MAQTLLNEWEMDGPSEQLGDVIRLMERLLDGGNRKQLMESLCHWLQQQVLGSRALIGALGSCGSNIDDWHGPSLPIGLLLELDDFPLARNDQWQQRLQTGQMVVNGNLQQDGGWGMLGEAASNAGLSAGVALPVLKQDGQPLALICLFWLTPHLAMPREQLSLKRASRLLRIGLEHLQRQQILQENESAYRQLAESTNAPMLVIRGDTVAYANPAFVTLTGSPLQTNTRMGSLIHDEDRRAALDFLIQAQRQHIGGSCQFRLLRQDAHDAAVAAHISPISFHGTPAVLATLNLNNT